MYSIDRANSVGITLLQKNIAERHRKSLHPYGVQETSRIRTVQVVARRAREMLSHIRNHFGEEAESVDVENVDAEFTDSKIDALRTYEENCVPIISSFDSWLRNPWVENFSIHKHLR